jgi:hypothetical protein
VCDSLWQELPPSVTSITGEYLQAYGDVDQALSGFYERTIRKVAQGTGVDEEDLRNLFERTLITPAGTRGTVFKGLKTTGATGKTAGVNPLKRILHSKNGAVSNIAMEMLVDSHLIRTESRAGAQWYELTHDRFIEPIKKSNQEYVQQRRKHTVIAAGTILPLFMVAAVVWLVFELASPPKVLERIVEVRVEVREEVHPPILTSGGRFQRSIPIEMLGISTDLRRLTVNYGDGSSEVKGMSLSSNSLELDHVYQKVGRFTVSISSSEDELLRILVPVVNIPPSVEILPINNVTEGESLPENRVMEGASFSSLVSLTDSGQGPWAATVDFGDGSGSGPLEISRSNQTFTLEHTYSDNGTYEVAVTVEDEYGESGSGTTLIDVMNVTPQVNTVTKASIILGERYQGQGSFIDLGQDSWTVTVDYGDGSPVEALDYDAASKTFILSHIYEYEGAYTITVTVDDGGKEVGKNTAIVEVEKDFVSKVNN